MADGGVNPGLFAALTCGPTYSRSTSFVACAGMTEILKFVLSKCHSCLLIISMGCLKKRCVAKEAKSKAALLGLLMIDPQAPKLCACIIERILDLTRFDDGSFALTQESAASLPESYRLLGGLRSRTRQSGDQELLLAEIDGREAVLGNRIDPTAFNGLWRQRIGNYRTINPDKEYSLDEFSLSEESGVLCLHYRAPFLSEQEVRVPIQPIADNQAVILGLGRGAVEVVEIVEINGQVCLQFSGYIGIPAARE